MSIIADILTDMKTAIDGAGLGITADIEYNTLVDIKDLADTKVTLIPQSDSRELFTRRASTRDITVNINIQKKLPVDYDNDDIDEILELVEDIADIIQPAAMAVSGAAWISTLNDPIYSQEELGPSRLITSVLAVVYKTGT